MALTSWGKHLVIDATRCSASAIRCPHRITDFAKTLVKEIDMVAYGEPQVVRFGSGNKAGYTLVQLIETSNICAHFVEETDEMYLDVFSCKDFDQGIVSKVVREYFGSQIYMNSRVLIRNAPKLPFNSVKDLELQ